MSVDCVEQCLDVYLALLVGSVEADLYASSRGHFAVEGIRTRSIAIIEEELS